MEAAKNSNKQLALPTTIISTVDLGNLIRELETLDNFFKQAEARTGGESITPPRTAKTLENLAGDYGLNLLEEKDREKLSQFLEQLKDRAPVLHISFAAEPSAAFLKKIIEWLRLNVHPQILVRIGLQPSMAAGCIIRTPNKYFDFSMRRHFKDNLPKLVSAIHGEPGK